MDVLRDYGKRGASLRQIQRFIDEKHYEELAVHTLQEKLDGLLEQEKVNFDSSTEQYTLVRRSSSHAFDQLFN